MLESLGAEALRETLITFRTTLRAHMEGINRLNVYPVPDGDTGTNMARTLDAVVKELEGAAVDMGGTCDGGATGTRPPSPPRFEPPRTSPGRLSASAV